MTINTGDADFNSHAFRRALGNFATGVTIITARNADASELLDRLIEFQQELVGEIEEDEDWNGNIIENVGDEDTCSVESVD